VITLKAESVSGIFGEASRHVIATRHSYSSAAVVETENMESCSAEGKCALYEGKQDVLRGAKLQKWRGVLCEQ
jgi:hypothetical protein